VSTERWHLELVKEMNNLPVRWRPPHRPVCVAAPDVSSGRTLMAALSLLCRRGVGPSSWISSYRRDPVAFLLDAIGDAVNLWGPGPSLVYRNRAAQQLDLGRAQLSPYEEFTHAGHRFERRCFAFREGQADYVLEIIHPV